MAGSGVGYEACPAWVNWGLQGQSLPLGLLSQCGAGGGPRARTLPECDCQCSAGIPATTKCLRCSGRDGAAGCESGPADSEKLGGVPVLTSDDYNIYELVSILRGCHMMVSSRYHGIVTSMPGLVPSAGINMGERIRNLMEGRRHGDLLMDVDGPGLEAKLLGGVDTPCQ